MAVVLLPDIIVSLGNMSKLSLGHIVREEALPQAEGQEEEVEGEGQAPPGTQLEAYPRQIRRQGREHTQPDAKPSRPHIGSSGMYNGVIGRSEGRVHVGR
jgi:hypothetical protein